MLGLYTTGPHRHTLIILVSSFKPTSLSLHLILGFRGPISYWVENLSLAASNNLTGAIITNLPLLFKQHD